MSSNEIVPFSPAELALVGGDLGKLTPQQRSHYYLQMCESIAVNPLTQPFQYIVLNGKLTLYATRTCTDQLRATRKVAVSIINRERMDGLYIVTARAVMSDGRTDESIGVVNLDGLKGDALANALMKCETKAKRRVTLSACGLGWLDESEIETIPGAQVVAKSTAEQQPALEAGNGHTQPTPTHWTRDIEQVTAFNETLAKAHVDRKQALSWLGVSDLTEYQGSKQQAWDTVRAAAKKAREQAAAAPHWTADAAQVARFVREMEAELGLGAADIPDGLEVDNITQYQGSMEQAKSVLRTWVQGEEPADVQQGELVAP